VRYADDVVLIATSPKDLQELINRVRASSEKVGLLINTDKTKVMTCGNNGMNTRISLSGEVLEDVESFVYLGSIFISDGSCRPTQDIRKRLAMGRSAMQSLSSIWNDKDISTTTKVRLLKALVWSVAIYGSEGWTLRYSKEEKYIEAFEMWCYRRLLRILWTQHKTNEWILCKLKVDRTRGLREITEIGILLSYDTKR